MKRLVVTGPRQVEFEDVPVPDCPDDGLLIRALATAISTGTEIRVYRWIPVDPEGKFLHAKTPFPTSPVENGYSMVGEIAQVGKDVAGYSEGERVYVSETHKEYVAVSPEEVLKLPESIPTDQAVMLNIVGVGQKGLRTGTPTVGENVAVIGLGVIGLATMALCRSFGFRIAAIDMNETRLRIASEMGADLAISPASPGFQAEIEGLFDEGADLAIEAASTWRAIETSMDVVRTNGRVVVVARHTDMPHYNLVGHPYLSKRIKLRTAYGYEDDGQRWDRAGCMALSIDMLASGRLNIAPMITHRVSWQDMPDIYDRLDKGDLDVVGVVVDWRS